MKRHSIKQPAFTLVELLTTVTIVAVLTSLGFAATRGVTEKTRTTRCLNDLRQVGTALQLYVGDNSGRFPNTSHQGVSQSWTNTLAPFLKTNFLGRCCAVRNHRAKLTYAWNDALTDATGLGIMAATFQKPSTTMVVGELATNQAGEHFHFTSTRGGASRISPNQFKAEVNVQCHSSGANYLFADGHSENLSWTEVKYRLNQTSSNFLMP
jgi:prepilin-type processing-associated H-X9-DG protein/prepilin-type N-terminal cleavage/methylation domain-containing protein